MKKIHISVLVAACTLVAFSCKQDMVTLTEPVTPVIPDETYTKGTADFTKYVSIGNSLASGFEAGALFSDGQAHSFPSILAKSFQSAGGSTTFNQPDINSFNGYNLTYSDPAHGVALGRLVLYTPDGVQAHAVPTPAGYPGVPAPFNTADAITAYAGDKAALNNFGVPLILLGQALIPQTGGPPSGNPYFNPYYARFASNPGTSTIIGDAIGAQPTFFSFELGNNDVLGYAINGGDGTVPLTSQSDFTNYYTSAINALLNPATNPHNPKGVVSTIPNITTLPFFYTVAWNAIPLDAPTAALVTTELANGYNQFLLGMQQNGILNAAEVAARTLHYVAGQNGVLITDEGLTDLTPYMQGPYAPLQPYAKARQTTATDLVLLTAGSILGKSPGANPAQIYGVTVPLADKYILIPSETTAILTATAGFNATIASIAASHADQIAVADINAAFTSFVTNRFILQDGVTLTPNFAPPTAAFSEDGIHPNNRGYAFLANLFLSSIEAKFGAKLPHAKLSDYSGTGLPLGATQ